MKKFHAIVLGVAAIWTFVPAVLAVDTTANLPVFSDVNSTHPNYVAIKYLKTKGILNGYADGTFKPSQLVNRAEALKILLVGNSIQLPDSVANSSFPDVKVSDWFAKHVEQAKTLGIIKGNPDGTFAPTRNVSRAEFIKMLLVLNKFKADKWEGQQLFADVPKDQWFAPYLNYAGQAGLLTRDNKNMVYPARNLSRSDVAEILYLMTVIRNDKDTQFLIDQSESEMAQVEVYVGSQDPLSAKRASELSVDFTQQALKNMPNDNIVMGAAKLAKAYDYLMNAYISALKKDYVSAKDWADKTIAKAGEAWDANHDVQAIAKHLKDRANEIVAQFPQ